MKKKKKVHIQFKCPRCGYIYEDTPEEHKHHSSPDHEVRILEGKSWEANPKYNVVASTDSPPDTPHRINTSDQEFDEEWGIRRGNPPGVCPECSGRGGRFHGKEFEPCDVCRGAGK